jgi:hypothetical protein
MLDFSFSIPKGCRLSALRKPWENDEEFDLPIG